MFQLTKKTLHTLPDTRFIHPASTSACSLRNDHPPAPPP
jgi:hypothetical protein